MPTLKQLAYFAVHPSELRSILQWYVRAPLAPRVILIVYRKIWHDPPHRREPEKEPLSLQKCYDYLDLTSRSFSAVIKELHPELLVPICLFYLVLRGLDTIEDDMTIPLETKTPLLKDFDKVLEKDGWNFVDNGPNEKDRELLVNFHHVITEYKKIKPAYKVIIADIAKKMGDGMAFYCADPVHNQYGVNTIADYHKYCHYVAGVVGEGLTRLFVESELANPGLLERPDLHENMGQFLQHTNIIRDVREDADDKRRFWPKEVWTKHVDDYDDLFKKEHEEAALRCSSEMVLLALEKAPDCLYYLAGLKEQSVFNFAAIPQTMAIATLELCFRNPAIFQRNVKITKGLACQLMIESSQNLQVLYATFRRYARIIHKKNDPRDPNFLRISVACGKIEQFIETIFPSQDPDALVVKASGVSSAEPFRNAEEVAKRKKEDEDAKRDTFLMLISVSLVMALVFLSMVRIDPSQ